MSIKNLVFSGAEIRGITYIGVIKAIEELGIKDDIKNILGVSSGAIFAVANRKNHNGFINKPII